MPRRPGPPGELGELRRGSGTRGDSPLNLVSRSITTERAGMLMPERQGLGGEHHLDQAARRSSPPPPRGRRGSCRRGARRCPAPARRASGRSPARRDRRRRGRRSVALGDARGSGARSSAVGEAEPGVQAVRGGVVAAGAAEDEVDRRQQALVVEPLDHLHPPRRVERRRRRRSGPRRAGRAPRASKRSPSGLGRPSTSRGSRWSRSARRSPTRYSGSSSHRTVVLDDRGGGAAQRLRSTRPAPSALDTVADRHTKPHVGRGGG